MAKIFITGSADGLGLLSAKSLIALGHTVVLHARNGERANDAMNAAPGAASVLAADLSDTIETKGLANKANAYGRFDVVIHNAGIYKSNAKDKERRTDLLKVNTLAPYVLTCLMHKPARLIYLSSDMHLQGKPVGCLSNNNVTYSDTKLHALILAKAVATKWPDVSTNAVDPGWVPTRMGGQGAPDSLEEGYRTQVWLAESNDPEALVSGSYFHHKKHARYLLSADDRDVQQDFIQQCHQLTGVRFTL